MPKKSPLFLQTRLGRLFQVLLGLGFAYIFGSLAIDRGNLWCYCAAVVTIAFTIYQFVVVLNPRVAQRRRAKK